MLGESLNSPLLLLCLVPACLTVAGGILGRDRMGMQLCVVGQSAFWEHPRVDRPVNQPDHQFKQEILQQHSPCGKY